MLEELQDAYPDLAPTIPMVEQAFLAMVRVYRGGGKLLICGNGGSSADSEHIVGELMKGCGLPRKLEHATLEQLNQGDGEENWGSRLQKALPAISLSAHSALMTAIVNDQGSDLLFAQQVLGYGRVGDALIGISTSGNAIDVIRALRVAKMQGLVTIGLSGRSGGNMRPWCDILVAVPYDSTQKIQERHLPIYHTLCLMVEREFFAS